MSEDENKNNRMKNAAGRTEEVLKRTSVSEKDGVGQLLQQSGTGQVQRFLWVSMQRTRYWLEQLRGCWPRSSPAARLDDWPATDTWSVRHVSQCLSITRVPVLVDPCQMLFWGLKKRHKR